VTPAQRRALDRLARQARALQPDLVAAILRAYRLIAAQYSEAEVARLIAAGRIADAIDLTAPVDLIERALNPASVVLTEGVLRNARQTIPDLPAAARKLITAFDYLDPRIVTSIRRLDTATIRTIPAEMRQALRETIAAGIERGVNPRTMARNLRGTIGLAPNQAEAVRNYRAALEAGDMAKVRGYRLRDARFDALLRRDALTQDQIDRMVARYQERMLSFAAETHARTAALEAQKLGQQLAWDEAKASGALGDAEVVAVWVATADARVRDEHAAMDGKERPIDGVYDNGQRYPGEGEYNCRCSEIFRVRKPSFSLAA
jgi:hypothetical protein